MKRVRFVYLIRNTMVGINQDYFKIYILEIRKIAQGVHILALKLRRILRIVAKKAMDINKDVLLCI